MPINLMLIKCIGSTGLLMVTTCIALSSILSIHRAAGDRCTLVAQWGCCDLHSTVKCMGSLVTDVRNGVSNGDRCAQWGF